METNAGARSCLDWSASSAVDNGDAAAAAEDSGELTSLDILDTPDYDETQNSLRKEVKGRFTWNLTALHCLRPFPGLAARLLGGWTQGRGC